MSNGGMLMMTARPHSSGARPSAPHAPTAPQSWATSSASESPPSARASAIWSATITLVWTL